MAAPGHQAYTNSASFRGNFDRDIMADAGIFNRLVTDILWVNGSMIVSGSACFPDGTAADPGIRFCTLATGFFIDSAGQPDRLYTSIQGVEVMNVQSLVDGTHIVSADGNDLTVRTAHSTTGISDEAKFRTGDSSVSTSGQVSIHTGTGVGNLMGTIFDSGLIDIFTGNGTAYSSGDVRMRTGIGSGTAVSGDVSIFTGGSSVLSGDLALSTGSAPDSGNASLVTGSATNASSGGVSIASGSATLTATSGNVGLRSGAATAASGAITVSSGSSSATSGLIQIVTGAGVTGTGVCNITTGSATGAGATTGAITITTGSSSGAGGFAGGIELQLGSDDDVAGGTNPNVLLSAANPGNTTIHLVTEQDNGLIPAPVPDAGSANLIAGSTDVAGGVDGIDGWTAGTNRKITFSFGREWSVAPIVIVSQIDPLGAAGDAGIYVSAVSTTGFQVANYNLTVAMSTTGFYYFCIGYQN